jgi:hypothetical protein
MEFGSRWGGSSSSNLTSAGTMIERLSPSISSISSTDDQPAPTVQQP